MADSKLTYDQKRTFGPKPINYGGESARITALVRFDDECRNGHNTFSITGDIRSTDKRKRDGGWLAGGCIREEIAKHFPELAPLLKWHLCSSDQPLHYIANTVYLAGERDCWGLLKGEPKGFTHFVSFGSNPIKHRPGDAFVKFLETAPPAYDFEVIPYYHTSEGHTYAPKYTFGGFAEKWHQCPFDLEEDALDFLKALQTCQPKFGKVATSWGEGKARELDGARRAAIWPDATDEDLTAPGLEERLRARHPKLMAEFRAAVESLGFTW